MVGIGQFVAVGPRTVQATVSPPRAKSRCGPRATSLRPAPRSECIAARPHPGLLQALRAELQGVRGVRPWRLPSAV